MDNYLMAAGLVFLLVGVCMFARYLYLDYRVRKEKSFTVIAVGFLLFWFFGGSALMVAGAVLLAFLVLRWLF